MNILTVRFGDHKPAVFQIEGLSVTERSCAFDNVNMMLGNKDDVIEMTRYWK